MFQVELKYCVPMVVIVGADSVVEGGPVTRRLHLILTRFSFAGFIMMCPQLFINYKMKSVAHLPWRQMTYKFLNTIIDDLFAFVIKMPTLHRLSVFRDGKTD